MGHLQENTVSSKNQLKVDSYVFYENENGNGLRVLFAGNSITLHGYKPEIGWMGHDYGMAASCKENDYVHIMEKEILSRDPDAAFCICQVAEWERIYDHGDEALPLFENARNFDADVIIMRLIENCPWNNFNNEAFIENYQKLINYLNKSGKAKVIITTGFWKHCGDDAIKVVGAKCGYKTVYLGHLEEDESNMAIGLFEHKGVSMHPGDKGMAEIAELLLDAMYES